jgi:squalene synthase HpnC
MIAFYNTQATSFYPSSAPRSPRQTNKPLNTQPIPDGPQPPAVDHYENFPVASWLLPSQLRAPVRLIYAFARQADDFADEGDDTPAQRLEKLSTFERELDMLERGEPVTLPLFQLLAPLIQERSLPVQLFRDLLSAFAQDVRKTRYDDFGEVMSYCRRSANPVGRLLLHLFRESDPRSFAYSDGICSALQLINFLQDIPIDYNKGRIYLPADEMRRDGISEAQIAAGDTGGRWAPFMRFQIERARRMLEAGAPLGRVLKGRIGLELRTIVLGGEQILRKLQLSDGDVFRHRPVLDKRDWLRMLARAVLGR